MKNVLSIAGVDPSGGAGILADIKVFIAHKVYAMGVVTATTSQNTKGIFGMELVDSKIISDGIKAIFEDIKVDAIKIGVVPSVDIINAVASTLREIKNRPPIILDPVMACKNGDIWLEGEAKEAIVKYLFPISTIITPNKFEAQEILKFEIKSKDDMIEAAKRLLNFGVKAVFLKGGEIDGNSVDLFLGRDEFKFFETKRLQTNSTHGSGCSLSSAIAANLANGLTLNDSVRLAKDYVFNAINKSFKVGSGCNPINHFYDFY
ncbi:bifunctional hydroxymethylpyrimidine kinase/phosphomethylpyrimidine kinase [Campylobacter sp. FMV-PI01]|uniref:hydroxymethylpyrimidine kinase n=1 Tax=Campylobacter portucalensis TaxID=2608384 RepID=A0A6L5WIV3_9BACT|nr:bifunctional hydroxymethylpyrimidine kinase/phosphomethylpyrimidine kinase [Campylobacter portucalensis]MSN96964.1 bifunctional hydroxymethylpyrimidine kinase/phosphomethylpyrimidine kinase [Campylobacter portucalensis]